MSATGPVTLVDFLRDPEIDEQRLELLDGQIIQGHGRTWHEGEIVVNAGILLHDLGEASISARAVIECADASLVPALSFFRQSPGIGDSYVYQPPNVVVDVRDSNRSDKQLNRMAEIHRQFGVESVWLVDPDREEVRIIEAGSERTLGRDDRLTSDAVPGLDAPVADLFRH